MTDTFKNGGELVDLGMWYAGRDKMQHAVSGFVLGAAGRRLGFGRLQALTLVLIAAIGMEMFEQLRYWRWRAAVVRWYRNKTGIAALQDAPPRPLFCDTFSWRDILATLAGALLAMP